MEMTRADVPKVAAGVHVAVDRMAENAHKAVERVANAAGPGADWLGEQSDSLKAAHSRVSANMSEYVSANPWKVIGIALAAGFLISRMLR